MDLHNVTGPLILEFFALVGTLPSVWNLDFINEKNVRKGQGKGERKCFPKVPFLFFLNFLSFSIHL